MVETNQIKKCNYQRKYMNIYGQIIHLTLTRKDNVLGVTLAKNSNIRFHFIILILTIVLNSISFKLNFISSTTFSVIVLIAVLYIYIRSGSIREESLIAIEPLGYQLNTKYIIGQKSTFIPFENVENIFINEVIFKQKIIYLLTILTKGSNSDMLIPLFMVSIR